MASVMLNSVVGLRPVKVHHGILSVRPNSSRRLTVRAGEVPDVGPVKMSGISDEDCEAAVVAGNIP